MVESSDDEQVKTTKTAANNKLDITSEFASFMSEFWDQYDTDKNGILDKQEFRKFIEEVYLDDDMPATALDEEKFEQIFWEFDIDHSGSISKHEMFDFLASMFGVSATQIDFKRVEALMSTRKNSNK